MCQPRKEVISSHSIREKDHYLILQMREIRLREAQWLAQDHTRRGAKV